MTINPPPTNNKPTLKIYRADGLQPGWEKRFDSMGSGTYFLHEEIDYSEHRIVPKVGERLAESKRFEDGEIYERQSDWLITKVQCYSSQREESDWQEIIFCSVKLDPIEAQWIQVPALDELIVEKVVR